MPIYLAHLQLRPRHTNTDTDTWDHRKHAVKHATLMMLRTQDTTNFIDIATYRGLPSSWSSMRVVVMRGVIDKAGGAVSSDVAIVGRTLEDVRKKKNLFSGRVDVDSGGL